MMKYTGRLMAILLLMASGSSLFGQAVRNVRAEVDPTNPNLVNVFYDLQGQRTGEIFSITIYSSYDNYQRPLQLVSGDVGENQNTGSGKRISWRAKEELGVFTGSVQFEIRSVLTFSPLEITDPKSGDTFKSGASMPVRWLGGGTSAQIQIDLYRSTTLDRTIGTTGNSRSFSWTVPQDITTGSDYSIRLFDTANPGNTSVSSGVFTLRAKGGGGGGGGKKWLFIGGGALVAGGVAALLLSGKDDPQPLPEPPMTPNDAAGVFGLVFGFGKR